MPHPTRTQAKLALKLIRQDVPMQRIIARLGGGFTELDIASGIDLMRIARNAAREPRGLDWSGRIVPARYVIDIPPEVIADQQHRLSLVPADTTALLCNDPLPGYSAADKSPSITPDIAIHRDPLDGLMFGRRRGSVRTGARYG